MSPISQLRTLASVPHHCMRHDSFPPFCPLAPARAACARVPVRLCSFVEVHGWPLGAPALNASSIALLHFHTSLDPRTTVAFPSDPVLGAVMTMAQGAQRSNLHSVVTDCPQRDERLGWSGDLSLSAASLVKGGARYKGHGGTGRLPASMECLYQHRWFSLGRSLQTTSGAASAAPAAPAK